MPRTIVITSGKGGVGKTTIAANLGIALANKSQSVVLIDLDVGLNNLDLALNMESNILYDLSDCLTGKCRLGQALYPHPKCPSLFVLACNNPETKLLLENNIERVIEKLKNHFDWIILDSPAGIDNGFLCAVSHADEAIVVVTPHISSLRDSDKVLDFLSTKKMIKIGIVINRIRGDLVASRQMMSAEQISNALKQKIIGIIPESDLLCTNSNFLLSNDAEAERLAFSILARNIMFDENKQLDYISKYKGLIGGVRRIVRRKI